MGIFCKKHFAEDAHLSFVKGLRIMNNAPKSALADFGALKYPRIRLGECGG
ncbi:MAG: hypothetical protein WCT19_00885 [Candidatus Paceibacterota bacterium]